MRLRALPLGSRLDGYVARLFALSYLTAFLLVVGLFLIIDMATNLDDYVTPDKQGRGPPTGLVGLYYALQLPFLYLQMSPYVTLVAGMFTAAKLAKNNEIVAALNAGISVRRLLASVYAGSALLAVSMFVLREEATAGLGRYRDLVHDRLVERRDAPEIENLVVRDRKGRPVVLREYVLGDPPEVHGLTARFSEGDSSISILAKEARPLPGERWALTEGRRLEDDGTERRSRAIDVLDDVRFAAADVELYWKARDKALDLSYGELDRLLQREPTSVRYQTLQQYNLTFPLAGLVLLLVGLPSLVASERSHAGERVARGFFLCVAYFGVDFVARTLGLQGEIGPLLSGWIPLVLFGSLGVVLTASMRS